MKKICISALFLCLVSSVPAQKVLVSKSTNFWDFNGFLLKDSSTFIHASNKSYYNAPSNSLVIKADTIVNINHYGKTQEVYRYDNAGRVLSIFSFVLEPVPVYVNRNKYRYDKEGNLTEHVAEHWNNQLQRWEKVARTVKTYSGSRLESIVIENVFAQNSWAEGMYFSFNEKNRVVSKIRRRLINSVWTDIHLELYSYNSAGERTLTLKRSFDTNGIPQPQDSITEIFKAGKTAGSLHYKFDKVSQNYVLSSKSEYTYDEQTHTSISENFELLNGIWKRKSHMITLDGRILEYSESEDGYPGTKYVAEYDQAGHLIVKYISRWNYDSSKWTLTAIEEFIFDQDGDLIEERLVKLINGNWVNGEAGTYLNRYYYVPEGSVVFTEPKAGFTIYPNPADDVVNVYWTELVNPAYVTVVDITGREILKAKPEFMGLDLELRIDNLSPGIYFLNLYDVSGLVASQRLMKR